MEKPRSLPRRILVTLRSRDSFGEVFVEQGPCGSVWVGPKDLEIGEYVELELVFVQELMIFHIRGSVEENDPQRGKRVCFDKNDDRALEVIQSYVHGQRSAHRRARRFQVSVPVQWADSEAFIDGETADLSQWGAAIRCEALPVPTSLIVLRFLANDPDQDDLLVRAEVIWKRQEPIPVFGVMFIAGEREVRERFEAYLETILIAKGDLL